MNVIVNKQNKEGESLVTVNFYIGKSTLLERNHNFISASEHSTQYMRKFRQTNLALIHYELTSSNYWRQDTFGNLNLLEAFQYSI